MFYPAHKPNEKRYGNHPAYKDKSAWESVSEHSLLVGQVAEEIIRSLKLEWLYQYIPFCYAFGDFHDIGKFKEIFYNYITTGFEPDPDNVSRAHAPIAARIIWDQFSHAQPCVRRALCLFVGGHHGRLVDAGDSQKYITRSLLSEKRGYENAAEVLRLSLDNLPIKRWLDNPPKFPNYQNVLEQEFVMRILFAICTKADHLATQRYSCRVELELGNRLVKLNRPVKPLSLKRYRSLLVSLKKRSLQGAQATGKEAEINLWRRRFLSEALKTARTKKSPFFSLDLPTGGAKTFVGSAFCYRYALTNNLKRMFYIAPFLNLTEQTASVLCRALCINRKTNQSEILEHTSGGNITEKLQRRLDNNEFDVDEFVYAKIGDEEWRPSIVISTIVQLIESLFTNKSTRSHRLLNLSNSIIFLDEFHLLPIDMRRDVSKMLMMMARKLNSTIVFSSATNTPWQKIYTPEEKIVPIVKMSEVPDIFHRVNIKYSKDKLHLSDLANKLKEDQQVVCIVNTKQIAQDLAKLLPHAFVLTALQTKRERRAVLRQCEKHLESGLPVCLIATQSIESGVDIDFPKGYRQLCPLESIIQSAGRVNRNWRYPQRGDLIVFDLSEDFYHQHRLKSYDPYIGIVKEMIEKFGTIDIYSREQLIWYFMRLDETLPSTRTVVLGNTITNVATCQKGLKFETVANNMSVITSNTTEVVVIQSQHEKEIRQWVAILRDKDANVSMKENALRHLNEFTVTLWSNQLDVLGSRGFIEKTLDEIDIQCYNGPYNSRYGIPVELCRRNR